eukprot:m.411301 g.411301  ORF g.411301 m.411301 type:complete len:232 (-) comp28624_c0_seq1:162-857(-)
MNTSGGMLWLMAVSGIAACMLASPVDAFQSGPDPCPSTTPGPSGTNKCPLKLPTDPEFGDICHPGATGHAGGAEQPDNRCDGVKYGDGVFRCACCGAPVFYAATKIAPAGDGWPAFNGTGSWISNGTYAEKGNSTVCTPPTGGTEVVCSNCGSHLGDFFAAGTLSDYAYYCIDGVCLLPPGAAAGDVCQPPKGADAVHPTSAEAYKALRSMLREQGHTSIENLMANHDHHE